MPCDSLRNRLTKKLGNTRSRNDLSQLHAIYHADAIGNAPSLRRHDQERLHIFDKEVLRNSVYTPTPAIHDI